MRRRSKQGRAGAKALRRYRRKKARMEMCSDKPEITMLMLFGCTIIGCLVDELLGIRPISVMATVAAVWLCVAWVLGYGPGLPKWAKKLRRKKG